MMRSKRRRLRLNKKGKAAVLILCLIIILLISKLFGTIDDGIFKEIKDTKEYYLKIDYDKTGVKKVDNRVKKYIKNLKDKFIKEAEDKNTDVKHELLIDGFNETYNNIYFTHISAYKYSGGPHYDREDISFVYDKKKRKLMNITDFLKDKKAFNELSDLVKDTLNAYAKEKDIEFDSELLKKGTEAKKDNYKYFNFNSQGLTIIFLPLQISSWGDGEIKITLNWKDINKLLKEKYQNNNYKEENPEPKKEVIKTRDISKFKDKKLVAFTFDDGPNKKTTSILLDYLEKEDARVTFFVLGNRLSYNEDVLKRAYNMGNEIGSHTYSHRNLYKLSDEEIKDEINKTNKQIQSIIGVEPILIRPPYGNTNNHIKSLAKMHTICWDVDSIDWKLKNRNKIKDEIIANVHDGAVVLVHDIYEESVNGAILAMKELKEEGYEFVTISELAILKEKILDYETTYRSFYNNTNK